MAEPLPLLVNRIFDVVVVGAGLCGLALARNLSRRGQTVLVLEARNRLGGRVLSQTCTRTGQALDLGAGWFWPETEPRVAALLAEYGLASTAQHDPGDALWLTDPNRDAERRVDPTGIHAGAQRIQGGAASLAQALAADLPAGSIRTGVALQSLQDHGSFIELITSNGPALRARQVVLAVPARLLHEHITFTPALPESVWQALAATPTWMAAQAKSVTTFATPFWREAGHSGNAFVRHPQAVLGEVFDASTGEAGALGGFVALNAAQREHFQRGLPLLIDSQLAQLFGQAAQDGQAHFQDWAKEPWTCAALDRNQPPELPQNQPLLRQALWSGRLFLGGSETATHGAGHMEGALESADRLSHALSRPLAQSANSSSRPSAMTNNAALSSFANTVQALRDMAPQRYRQHLTRLLSTQQPELITQRALLAAADQVYSEALAQLDSLMPALTRCDSEVVQGRHALTATLLAPFAGWNKALLEAALQHNASSCALSNFPAEHKPDAELLQAITLDLGAAWREFALELNTRLLMAEGATADAV
jgi:monoamine oxidase